MSEEEREDVVRQERGHSGEIIKFAVLVLILAITVLVVAVTRPLIFDNIVPAVLGWDQPAGEEAPPTPQPTVTPAALEEGTATAAPTATASPPPPTATPRVHVVQPGDNLTRIAQQYGVSVDAIIQANRLDNAHRIHPGQRLVIPEG